MTDDAKPTGRPKGSATGQTPMRTLRMGPLWEQGQAAAEAHGMTMTALVEEALREKLAKLERRAAIARNEQLDRISAAIEAGEDPVDALADLDGAYNSEPPRPA